MNRTKIIELAKKVKALSVKGKGGERHAAKLKLDRICKKHNINLDELEFEEPKECFFILRDKNERELLTNIVCMILDVPALKWKERNSCVKILLTPTQYDDINNAFCYYQRMYDDYKRYIIQGIITRNVICYIPKQQMYTQENVVQSDIQPPTSPPTPSTESKSEDVINENKKESFSEKSDKKTKKNKFEDTESPIDPIKLMKIAVALEKNPWIKIDHNKKLIDDE